MRCWIAILAASLVHAQSSNCTELCTSPCDVVPGINGTSPAAPLCASVTVRTHPSFTACLRSTALGSVATINGTAYSLFDCAPVLQFMLPPSTVLVEGSGFVLRWRPLVVLPSGNGSATWNAALGQRAKAGDNTTSSGTSPATLTDIMASAFVTPIIPVIPLRDPVSPSQGLLEFSLNFSVPVKVLSNTSRYFFRVCLGSGVVTGGRCVDTPFDLTVRRAQAPPDPMPTTTFSPPPPSPSGNSTGPPSTTAAVQSVNVTVRPSSLWYTGSILTVILRPVVGGTSTSPTSSAPAGSGVIELLQNNSVAPASVATTRYEVPANWTSATLTLAIPRPLPEGFFPGGYIIRAVFVSGLDVANGTGAAARLTSPDIDIAIPARNTFISGEEIRVVVYGSNPVLVSLVLEGRVPGAAWAPVQTLNTTLNLTAAAAYRSTFPWRVPGCLPFSRSAMPPSDAQWSLVASIIDGNSTILQRTPAFALQLNCTNSTGPSGEGQATGPVSLKVDVPGSSSGMWLTGMQVDVIYTLATMSGTPVPAPRGSVNIDLVPIDTPTESRGLRLAQFELSPDQLNATRLVATVAIPRPLPNGTLPGFYVLFVSFVGVGVSINGSSSPSRLASPNLDVVVLSNATIAPLTDLRVRVYSSANIDGAVLTLVALLPGRGSWLPVIPLGEFTFSQPYFMRDWLWTAPVCLRVDNATLREELRSVGRAVSSVQFAVAASARKLPGEVLFLTKSIPWAVPMCNDTAPGNNTTGGRNATLVLKPARGDHNNTQWFLGTARAFTWQLTAAGAPLPLPQGEADVSVAPLSSSGARPLIREPISNLNFNDSTQTLSLMLPRALPTEFANGPYVITIRYRGYDGVLLDGSMSLLVVSPELDIAVIDISQQSNGTAVHLRVSSNTLSRVEVTLQRGANGAFVSVAAVGVISMQPPAFTNDIIWTAPPCLHFGALTGSSGANDTLSFLATAWVNGTESNARVPATGLMVPPCPHTEASPSLPNNATVSTRPEPTATASPRPPRLSETPTTPSPTSALSLAPRPSASPAPRGALVQVPISISITIPPNKTAEQVVTTIVNVLLDEGSLVSLRLREQFANRTQLPLPNVVIIAIINRLTGLITRLSSTSGVNGAPSRNDTRRSALRQLQDVTPNCDVPDTSDVSVASSGSGSGVDVIMGVYVPPTQCNVAAGSGSAGADGAPTTDANTQAASVVSSLQDTSASNFVTSVSSSLVDALSQAADLPPSSVQANVDTQGSAVYSYSGSTGPRAANAAPSTALVAGVVAGVLGAALIAAVVIGVAWRNSRTAARRPRESQFPVLRSQSKGILSSANETEPGDDSASKQAPRATMNPMLQGALAGADSGRDSEGHTATDPGAYHHTNDFSTALRTAQAASFRMAAQRAQFVPQQRIASKGTTV